jgi:hypothetical protein
MNDKLPTPCEHCKATGLFEGGECPQCDGKGYRLIVDGRLISTIVERPRVARRRQPRR